MIKIDKIFTFVCHIQYTCKYIAICTVHLNFPELYAFKYGKVCISSQCRQLEETTNIIISRIPCPFKLWNVNNMVQASHLIFRTILLQYGDFISWRASSRTLVKWSRFTGSVCKIVVSLTPESSVWSLNKTVGVVCLLRDLLASYEEKRSNIVRIYCPLTIYSWHYKHSNTMD